MELKKLEEILKKTELDVENAKALLYQLTGQVNLLKHLIEEEKKK